MSRNRTDGTKYYIYIDKSALSTLFNLNIGESFGMLRDSAKRRPEKIPFFSSIGKYSVYPYSSIEYYRISQHFLPDRFNLSRYTLELKRNRIFPPSKGETTEVDGSMVGFGAVERWKRKRERKSNSNLDPYSQNNLWLQGYFNAFALSSSPRDRFTDSNMF